jgi:hypothetical protein
MPIMPNQYFYGDPDEVREQAWWGDAAPTLIHYRDSLHQLFVAAWKAESSVMVVALVQELALEGYIELQEFESGFFWQLDNHMVQCQFRANTTGIARMSQF